MYYSEGRNTRGGTRGGGCFGWGGGFRPLRPPLPFKPLFRTLGIGEPRYGASVACRTAEARTNHRSMPDLTPLIWQALKSRACLLGAPRQSGNLLCETEEGSTNLTNASRTVMHQEVQGGPVPEMAPGGSVREVCEGEGLRVSGRFSRRRGVYRASTQVGDGGRSGAMW